MRRSGRLPVREAAKHDAEHMLLGESLKARKPDPDEPIYGRSVAKGVMDRIELVHRIDLAMARNWVY